MIIPIKCFTCGTILANKYRYYQEEVRITKNITAKFYDAGHILGAASIQIKIKEGNKKRYGTKRNTFLFHGGLSQ
jgi:Cft2 family RNA processing exonuclease